jgi:pimeloyl-ACP methyl ester carboxylesterase
LSTGAVDGPIFSAVDGRFAASILLGGGLSPQETRPEANPAVFAPHSFVPTLMINGRDDFIMPYDVSEQPLLAALGTPPGQKRLVRLEGGHIPSNRLEIIREVLDWLDRYLGPVQSSAQRGQ